MDFHWAGDNAVEEGDVAGSINLSPVLKRKEDNIGLKNMQ